MNTEDSLLDKMCFENSLNYSFGELNVLQLEKLSVPSTEYTEQLD